MVEIIKLSKSYNTKEIFKEVSITLKHNLRYGLVGDNGSGKTTFFKLLTQEEPNDGGRIIFHKNNPKIGYMKQELVVEGDITILEYIKRITGIFDLEAKLFDSEKQLGTDYLSEYGDLLSQYELLDGYNIKDKVENLMYGIIGKNISTDKLINSLSAGEKSKIMLIAILVSNNELLLFDEPTNNLDYKSIKYLVDYIKHSKIPTLIISHDRLFLDSTVNYILEIDAKNKHINEYSGDYTFFEKQKLLNNKKEQELYEKNKDTIKRYERLIQKSKEWNNRGLSKIKKLPDNDKSIKFAHEQGAQNSSGNKIKSLFTKIDQINLGEKPEIKKTLKFDFNSNNYSHSAIKLEGLVFKYPNSDLKFDLNNFEIANNDRVVLLGDNGSGKTTLLKLITGDLNPNLGKVTVPNSLDIGNFQKEYSSLSINKTIYETLTSFVGDNMTEINRLLTKFQFKIEEGKLQTNLLSPGQKVRFVLLIFYIKKCNAIIFDEPTNHLDLEATQKLEENLVDFEGLLIISSHDYYFLKAINFNRFILMENNQIKEIDSLEEYFLP